MHITTRAAKRGTFALVVIGLAAGVVQHLPEPADVAVAPTVHRDPGSWTMPLDGYVQPGSDKDSYAFSLVVQPCLRTIGIDSAPPWATAAGLDALSDERDTPAGGNTAPALAWSRPLDAESARTRGYHGASTAGADADGIRTWGEDPARNAAFADAPQREVDRCFQQAYRTLGTADPDGAVQSASIVAKRLTYLATMAAREDPAVVTAAGRWRTCMAPADVIDLPQAPSDMPSQSIQMDHGTNISSTPVQDAEVAIAQRDVACQETSGYRDALYDAAWDRLLHVTASDSTELRRTRPDQRDVDRRLDTTIRRLAPAAPADAG
ncbi:hypothetical protein [Curtobacterium sp. MCBA15_001]|uniref:hypothetical protein n=1 Tax=Curtobacterium sp. MCBA15_001 TaxID=1898731 RepID=UPI0008DD48FD|nr:hypothetical protein [Curtobacterium sp. MCBA15_001]OIH94098.1 hypothetical protein BIU90_06175 [Curtobacterium sp. MCBA15_001]